MTGTRSDLLNRPDAMLATPNSASVVLGADSIRQVRPKNLFYVRFTRPLISTSGLWREEVGFICKAIEKPAIEPQTDEKSQYGKKRTIHTGIKYNPITITLYDTTDNLAVQMWNEYAKYHFGAFNQSSIDAWQDDIIAEVVSGAETGFGLKSRPAGSNATSSLNSQYFFDSIQIFDLYGGRFTRTDLIHPKISAFTPDPVDFEDSAPATIRMTFFFEGVLYANNGAPMPLSSDQALYSIFANEFSGQVLDVAATSSSASMNTVNRATDFLDSLNLPGNGIVSTVMRETGLNGNAGRLVGKVLSGASVLSKYGNFSFGSKAAAATTATQNDDFSDVVAGGFVPLAYPITDDIITAPAVMYETQSSDGISLTSEGYAYTNASMDGTAQIGKKGTFT